MDKLLRMMQKAEELADRLLHIVDFQRQKGGAAGYFAALYLRMTRAVISGIAAGRFEDGARMERLILVFGARYLEANERYEAGISAGKACQA